MTIHADPLFINAEVERRLELAGVNHYHHDVAATARPVSNRRLGRLVTSAVRALRAPRKDTARDVTPCVPAA